MDMSDFCNLDNDFLTSSLTTLKANICSKAVMLEILLIYKSDKFTVQKVARIESVISHIFEIKVSSF